jgi:hypothetical protein
MDSPAAELTQALSPPWLVLYERACAALAAAKSVDEAKQILDASVAMRAYAKQAKKRNIGRQTSHCH